MPATSSDGEVHRSLPRHVSFDWYPWALAAIVLLTRVLTRSQLYFGDAPAHMRSIRNGTYVIQPPGYWLFNRMAGLFSDPTLAMLTFNISCSVLGVVVFYYCARMFFASRSLAMWAAAMYAAVFYAWFAAETHCTYTSQLFFPVLAFFCLLKHERTGRAWYLYAAAAAFAVGAGMRPSDGAFFLPFVGWRLLKVRPRYRAVIACAVIAILCLAWLVPTILAYQRVGWASLSSQTKGTIGTYISFQTGQESILARGFTPRTTANVTRVLVALSFAFWPFLIPLLFLRGRGFDSRAVDLCIWILPGLAFFLLRYFGVALYLDYATAPIILLGLMLLEHSPRRLMLSTGLLFLAWNSGFFLFFRPVVTRSLPVNVINIYAGRFTWFSLQHRANPDMNEVLKDPQLLLGPDT